MIQQNTNNGSALFNRSWAEYKVGFNDSRGNYWLGNDLLSQLTITGRYKLRFDLQSRDNRNWYYAEYSTFIVQPESANYRLHVSGFSGNAGYDAFGVPWKNTNYDQNNQMFTTFDRDNDQYSPGNCASPRGGGFWYNACNTFCVNCFISHFYWYGLSGSGLMHSSRMWLHCK